MKNALQHIEAIMKIGFTEDKEFDTIEKCQKGRMIALARVQLNTALLANNDDRYAEVYPIMVENLWRAEQLLLRMLDLMNNQKRK